MQFTKMHGIGNDFVMVNCFGADGASIAEEAQQRAVLLCDRKFGVGADGVILILPGIHTPFRMIMVNPDGSEAEMCGNGIRCYAKYVCDYGLLASVMPDQVSSKDISLPVETGAGLLFLQPSFGPDGKVTTVRVDMGEPILQASRIPTTLGDDTQPVISAPLTIGDETFAVTAVSMGNPHAVIFVRNTAEFPVAKIGPQVEIHPAFPRRTNTEFIEILSEREINFRVWERGAAETLACGTGACGAVVACVLNGCTERNVLVHLPGGDLEIEWSAADNHVYMTGSATTVFEGDI